MADTNEYYEFLYAYTLGCLDEDDLVNLKQYLESSDDFYWQELGDFQNLSALLPSMLSIENPDPEVKDRVARKLYRIRNEIKAKRDKRKNERMGSEASDKEKIEPETSPEPVEENIVEKEPVDINSVKTEKGVEGFEVVTSVEESAETVTPKEPEKENTLKGNEQTLNFNDAAKATDDEIDTVSEEKKGQGPSITSIKDSETKIASPKRLNLTRKRLVRAERKEKKKSRVPFVIVSVLMFILAMIFVFLYFRVSSNVKGYESQIISLHEQLGNLKEQLRQNRDLRSVLASKSLRTVNLKGTDIAENIFGKLFINMGTNHGVVQLSNLPQLQGSGTYQLWIYIYDNYLSLGKFSPTESTVYFSFDTPQLDADSNVSFLVTEEPGNGSLQPGSKVYLKGSF